MRHIGFIFHSYRPVGIRITAQVLENRTFLFLSFFANFSFDSREDIDEAYSSNSQLSNKNDIIL